MRSGIVLLSLCPLLVQPCAAQCDPQWTLRAGLPGTDGRVRASTFWDADGPGPLPSRLVIGGDFTMVGTVAARGLAIYDAALGLWSEVGGGVAGSANTLAIGMNGELIVGGMFTSVGTVPAAGIARFDGSAWQVYGSGFDHYVASLLPLPNGELVAGGMFSTAGGVAANHVARWTGTAWQAMGIGFFWSATSLLRMPNGDVLAAAGPTIQRWNGVAWSVFATAQGGVYSLALEANGNLLAGGNFYSLAGVTPGRIARWNGAAWSSFPAGPNSEVDTILVQPNGEFVVGGILTFVTTAGPLARQVARWNGTAWEAMGNGFPGYCRTACASPTGSVHIAGEPASSSDPRAPVLRWSGTTWDALGEGANDMVQAIAVLPNGDLVIGGRFTRVGDLETGYIARWDGTSWHALGGGLDGGVHALEVLPSGDLVAGGWFTQAGGVGAQYLARWNGVAWSPMASPGPDGVVNSLLVLPSGELLAGGAFGSIGGIAAGRFARWNGTTWSSSGAAFDGAISAMIEAPGGVVVVGGSFQSNGGAPTRCVAQWNGATWSEIGGGIGGFGSGVLALAMSHGDLVVGGWFSSVGPGGSVAANRIARWDGTVWHALGSGMAGTVFALATLDNGDVVVARDVGSSANPLARWNGAMWSMFGATSAGAAYTLLARPGPSMLVGGSLLRSGNSAIGSLGRLTPACVANVASYGTGCTSSAGPVALAATSSPWVGTLFEATATGVPGNAFAVAIYGLAAVALPIAALLPQGGAGCDLLVTLDMLELRLPSGGVVQTQFAIPNSTAIAGIVLRHQVAPIELDLSGNIVAITSSNALAATIGAF